MDFYEQILFYQFLSVKQVSISNHGEYVATDIPRASKKRNSYFEKLFAFLNKAKEREIHSFLSLFEEQEYTVYDVLKRSLCFGVSGEYEVERVGIVMRTIPSTQRLREQRGWP